MTYVIVSMISLLVGGWTMQWVAWLSDRRAKRQRRLGADRRLGLLGTSDGLSAEAQRAALLEQLGEAGTYKTFNCGEILHVDYERSILTCSRRGRFM